MIFPSCQCKKEGDIVIIYLKHFATPKDSEGSHSTAPYQESVEELYLGWFWCSCKNPCTSIRIS